jgi:hypothetical protein
MNAHEAASKQGVYINTIAEAKESHCMRQRCYCKWGFAVNVMAISYAVT